MFTTNSLALAAFFICSEGMTFVDGELENKSADRVVLLFEPDELAKKLAKEYLDGKARVDPYSLFQAYHKVKDKVYEVKRSKK